METPLFFPGQRVICVNGDFSILLAQDPSIVVPVEGQEYTIRRNMQLLHAVGVLLEELINTHAIPKGRKLEPNFNQRRFAAVQEQAVQALEEEYADAA